MPSDPIPDPPLDTTPGENPSPPVAPRHRLSIAHLMLWTLGTAIALGICLPLLELRTASTSDSEAVKRRHALQTVIELSLIPFGGAGIGALILAIGHRIRGGKSFPVQPGHWLLVVFGVYYGVFRFAQLLLAWFATVEVLYWGDAAVALLLLPVQVLPLLYVRDAPRWTVLFAVELLPQLGSAAVRIAYAIAFTWMLSGGDSSFDIVSLTRGLRGIVVMLACAVSVIVLIREVLARPRRDYLHWTGCLTKLADVTMTHSTFIFGFMSAFR